MPNGLAPGLLIAAPQLSDENFVHAVVLLLHHDEEGAMGIVINRPLELPLGYVAQQQGLDQSSAEGPVFFGGPVEVYRGFVLHGEHSSDDDTLVADDVYITGSVEVLRSLLVRRGARFRLFLGYAGWGPGQLDAEMTAGSWLTGEFHARHLFDIEAPQLWEAVLAEMGIDPAVVMQSDGGVQ